MDQSKTKLSRADFTYCHVTPSVNKYDVASPLQLYYLQYPSLSRSCSVPVCRCLNNLVSLTSLSLKPRVHFSQFCIMIFQDLLHSWSLLSHSAWPQCLSEANEEEFMIHSLTHPLVFWVDKSTNFSCQLEKKSGSLWTTASVC